MGTLFAKPDISEYPHDLARQSANPLSSPRVFLPFTLDHEIANSHNKQNASSKLIKIIYDFHQQDKIHKLIDSRFAPPLIFPIFFWQYFLIYVFNFVKFI